MELVVPEIAFVLTAVGESDQAMAGDEGRALELIGIVVGRDAEPETDLLDELVLVLGLSDGQEGGLVREGTPKGVVPFRQRVHFVLGTVEGFTAEIPFENGGGEILRQIHREIIQLPHGRVDLAVASVLPQDDPDFRLNGLAQEQIVAHEEDHAPAPGVVHPFADLVVPVDAGDQPLIVPEGDAALMEVGQLGVDLPVILVGIADENVVLHVIILGNRDLVAGEKIR